MKKHFLCPIIIIVLVNCSTPYHPKGMLGGFSSTKVYDNMYRLEFKGNQHTKVSSVFDYLERRCAEIATENGYDYFIVYQDSSYIEEINFTDRPGLDDKLEYQRAEKYLITEDHVLDTDPLQTLYERKTKINRTYNRHMIRSRSINIVAVYKIKLENKVIENLKDYFYSAYEILEKYKID